MEGVNLSVNLAALPRPLAPASARPASGIPRRTSGSPSSPTRPYSARPKGPHPKPHPKPHPIPDSNPDTNPIPNPNSIQARPDLHGSPKGAAAAAAAVSKAGASATTAGGPDAAEAGAADAKEGPIFEGPILEVRKSGGGVQAWRGAAFRAAGFQAKEGRVRIRVRVRVEVRVRDSPPNLTLTLTLSRRRRVEASTWLLRWAS